MKPESGKTLSIWTANFDVPKFEPLDENIQTDVCIIGAGITGLTCGYMLSKENKKVVIIEDGNIGSGETGRTTAHITNVIDDRLSEIIKMHGEEGARLAVQSQTEAINTIERIVKNENIDCEFKRLDGYLYFLPEDSDELVNDEFECAKKFGIQVKKISESPLGNFSEYKILKFPDQGQFHILKYISGLAKAISNNGGKIYTQTHVNGIEDGETVELTTGNGKVIKAKDVIVATNSPISDRTSVHTKQAAYRTYAIGIEIPRGFIKEALYWDNAEPYHYIRVFNEKENDILFIGGEDHKTGQDEHPEERFSNLKEWTEKHFGHIGEIKYAWSGQVMEPVDGLSFIGKDPENNKHIYIATGDSGMGITHGTFSGIILRDLIMVRENEWSKVYDPKRIKFNALGEMLKEGINTVAQFVDFISPGDISTIDKLTKDEGAIIRHGLKKIAVYKDINNKIYKFSALCPHLKCVIQWNSLEKTWDCPCHGSRFDAKGNVINGPAISDLELIEE